MLNVSIKGRAENTAPLLAGNPSKWIYVFLQAWDKYFCEIKSDKRFTKEWRDSCDYRLKKWLKSIVYFKRLNKYRKIRLMMKLFTGVINQVRGGSFSQKLAYILSSFFKPGELPPAGHEKECRFKALPHQLLREAACYHLLISRKHIWGCTAKCRQNLSTEQIEMLTKVCRIPPLRNTIVWTNSRKNPSSSLSKVVDHKTNGETLFSFVSLLRLHPAAGVIVSVGAKICRDTMNHRGAAVHGGGDGRLTSWLISKL